MKNLIAAMILFFCPVSVFAGFAAEPLQSSLPPGQLIAQNIDMIMEIQNNLQPRIDEGCVLQYGSDGIAADVCRTIDLADADDTEASVGFIAPSDESPQSFAIAVKHKQAKNSGIIIFYNDNMDGIPENTYGLNDGLSELEGILFYNTVLKKIVKHLSMQSSAKELGAI
jgi:hypothetical protein